MAQGDRILREEKIEMVREHLKKEQPVTEQAATQEVVTQEVLHSSQAGLQWSQEEQAPQATTWSTSIEKKKSGKWRKRELKMGKAQDVKGSAPRCCDANTKGGERGDGGWKREKGIGRQGKAN